MKKITIKREPTIIPNYQQISSAWQFLEDRKNKKAETHLKFHKSLFLLCWRSGLRVTEAISFDLNLRHSEPQFSQFYLIRGKGRKDRWVPIDSQTIKYLRNSSWKPNITRRNSFFTFLKKLKKDLQWPAKLELAPHTLRRCFATHNALAGVNLPNLQALLGHNKISTTALYIKDSGLAELAKLNLLNHSKGENN